VGGVSDVTSIFINSGTLNVLSGSIEFSGGFTNTGVIHGLVTQSGGVTTVSAAVQRIEGRPRGRASPANIALWVRLTDQSCLCPRPRASGA
jgi:hypothetical protein